MAEKTIPDLNPITTIAENDLFPVDTGIQTYKITAENLALFVSSFILPAGLLVPTAAAAAPDGWLLADGSAVSRTTYSRLFVAIGSTYGVGDGTTTFNLPDLRGRVVAGKDNMGGSAANRITNAVAGIVGTTLGATGGSEAYTPAGTMGGSQSIAHTHTIYHYHQWNMRDNPAGDHFTVGSSPSVSKTTITAAETKWAVQVAHTAGGVNGLAQYSSGAANSYTTGVIAAPSGSGGTAASGPMSVNATVNGSNFTFTGTAAHRVQPTLIANYLIRY